MVNTRIVSRYADNPPADENADLAIPGGPLYPASEVQTLLAQGGGQAISAWTRKSKNDLQKYSLDLEQVCTLLEEALRNGRYKGAQWCVQRPDGPWAACDAYQLVRDEWIENAHKFMRMEYYIKFALSKTGQVLLLVSCHLSGDR